MDGWMDGWDGWMDGWMDGWIDIQNIGNKIYTIHKNGHQGGTILFEQI